MTIQQIADRLNMTPRAIRFYEEKGLLKPHRQPFNQYRSYTEADAWRLQTIGALRELGIPVEEIKRLLEELDEGAADEIAAYLNTQRSCLFQRWAELKQLLSGLDALLEQFSRGDGLDLDDLIRLAEREKRLKAARGTWTDRWNFDRLADEFDERLFSTEGYPVNGEQYEEVLGEVVTAIQAAPGERGLDLGAGTGNLAGRLVTKGAHVCAVDQSGEMLKRCKAKYPAVETKLGNMMAVPYFDAAFDWVVSSFALQHLNDEQRPLALQEMSRVLRPHGRVCIADIMFRDETHRAECVDRWRRQGDEARLRAAESRTYAYQSAVLDWFRGNGYVAYAQAFGDEPLQLIVAVKRS